MAYTDKQFAQAANNWDLETLYTDLASAKAKRLTPIEKLHLQGLLCGYSPAEIAERLNKNVKGVEVDLCNTLYKYVKNLVNKCDEKVENWRNITEWLEEAGYKTQLSNQFQLSDNLPLDVSVKRTNISFDNNKIIVDLNLRIVAFSPKDAPIKEDLNANVKG